MVVGDGSCVFPSHAIILGYNGNEYSALTLRTA
jgi:hypothetical protein